MMTKEIKAALSLCAAVFLFGLGSTLLKILYLNFPDFPFTSILTFRLSMATLCFFVMTVIKNPKSLKVRFADLLYFFIFGTAGIFTVQYFLTLAVKNIPVGLATFIQSSATILICAYALVFLKERMSKYKIAGLILGLIGLAVIFWMPSLLQLDNLRSVGLVAAIISAFAKAFYILFGKKGASKYDRGAMMSYGLLSASLASLLFSSPLKTIRDFAQEPAVWLLITLLAFFCTFISLTLYFKGLAHLPASTAGILNIIEPVAGTVTAYLILGEVITLQQLAGCLLIVLAIVVLQFEYLKKSAPVKNIL